MRHVAVVALFVVTACQSTIQTSSAPLATTGAAYCWGDYRNGQACSLSGAYSTYAGLLNVPNLTFGLMGPSHGCYLSAGLSMYCCGLNSHGQFGGYVPISGTAPIYEPTPVLWDLSP